MKYLFLHEMKRSGKNLLIWLLCVGGLCFSCIMLFTTMEESMADMAEQFSQMGAFSDAFGMSSLSIATLEGFYATEVGTIFGLGGAMFAALLGSCVLSKEEDGHTGEFLYTLPVSRSKAIIVKGLSLISNILIFNIGCVALYLLGFVMLGEEIDLQRFFLYHGMQLLMQCEVGGICFLLSAGSKRNRMGIGLGIALLLYVLDLMARVIPKIEDLKVITPFSYANASDIFSTGDVEQVALVIGIILLVTTFTAGHYVYGHRDLAA